jgi:uncharacterized protein YabE (DUF348 family)
MKIAGFSASVRLHVAMAIALAMVALLALWFPLISGHSQHASDQAHQGTPVRLTADGLTYAFESRAQTVSGALAEVGITLNSGDRILRTGVPVHPTAALRVPPPAVADPRIALSGTSAAMSVQPVELRLQRSVPFTLHEEGLALSLRSSQETVGEALAAAGVHLGPADVVTPSPETPLLAALHVYYRQASAVQLVVGDETRQAYTFAETVGELLQEEGVASDEDDRIDPALDTPVSDGMTATVTFVHNQIEVTEEVLVHNTVYRNDPQLELGQTQVLAYGMDGYVRRQYRVTYENGREVGRELVSQDDVLPMDRVVAQGSMIAPMQLVLDDGTVITYVQDLEMYATWYNAVSSGGDGITATGARLDVGIVAVDPRVIPLGTRLYIPGYGLAVAADTGGGIVGNRLDLGYPDDTHGWCCTGRITVYILA